MTISIRAFVALGVLAGFYLLGVGTLLWFAVVVYAELHYGLHGTVLVATVLSGLVFALSFVSALVAARKAARTVPTGMLLTREEQPELWSTITSLAQEVGTRPPDEIRLAPEVNAGVLETSRWMGLRPGTRRMVVGVPLLLGLTRGQLVAVMTHELGHYSGRHTRLAVPIHRGGHALVQVVDQLGPKSWVGRVFRMYAELYFRISSAVSRLQEVEADLTAARVAGRDTTISALRELRPLEAAWDVFLGSYLGPAHQLGLRPDGTAEGFLDLLEDPRRRALLQEIRDDGAEPRTSIFDSHPPTHARVALLGRTPDDAKPADDVPGYALLTDPDRTMTAFFASLYGDGSTLELTDWETVGASLGEQRSVAAAGALVHSIGTAPWRIGKGVTWSDVASELRSGRGPEHVARVADAGTTAQQRELATTLVSGLLARSLVESVGAEHRLDWSGQGLLVDAEGRIFPITEVARAAVETAGGADDLLAFATAHGIAVDQELAVAATEAVPSPAADEPALLEDDLTPRALGAIGPLRRDRTVVLALPGTVGLAVVPVGGLAVHLRVALALVPPGTALKLGTRLLRGGDEAMLRRRGAELLAWDDVVTAEVRERASRRQVLVITLASGQERLLAAPRTWDSTDQETPWGALHHFLGDRFTERRSSRGKHRTGSPVGVR